MRRALLLGLLVLAGCGSHAAAPVPAQLPPSPATWPPYPRTWPVSCWTRPAPGGSGVLRAAPSHVSAPTHATPRAIAAAVLLHLGDRRFVHAIAFGPPPPITRQHMGWWRPGTAPPKDALWAYIAAPESVATLKPSSPAPRKLAVQVAEWEADLVKGALRDELCAAGGAPLAGWSVSGRPGGVSDGGQALGQRFPSPAPAAFRARVAAVGRRYGFTVVSLRLLRPLQTAPLLVVRTGRRRKQFVADVPGIMRLLDPIRSARNQTAITFEGFFLEAEDAAGTFVTVDDVYRGETMGGEWSWNPCVTPYPHSTPFGSHC